MNTTIPLTLIDKISKFTCRTKDLLNEPCKLCGSILQVEMHHLTPLRKIYLSAKLMGSGPQKSNDLLTQTMININRKQIPLCQYCHIKVHKGIYDGPKIGSFLF